MGSISSCLTGLQALSQAGSGPLASLPVQLSASTLQSASKQDLVDLSSAALQLQQVDGIFGITPTSQVTTSPVSFLPSSGDAATQTASSLPSGVSAADLANATPQQQASIANNTIQQQMVQSLFYPTTSSESTINLTG